MDMSNQDMVEQIINELMEELFSENVKQIKRRLDDQSIENMFILNSRIEKQRELLEEQKTYINCDIRYLNLDFLTQRLGYFDVILMDPPWRIKGG